MTVAHSKSWLNSFPAQISFIATFLAILATNRYTITASYILLCLWALAGPKHVIKVLSLNYIITLLNPAVFNLPAEIGIFRWLILLIAGLRIIPLVTVKSIRFLLPLLLFLSWTSEH